MTQTVNDHLVLIVGKSSTGKSASLMGLENQESVIYMGTEAGKKLPFRSKMKEVTVSDPLQVTSTLAALVDKPEYRTIVIDSLTFLMDQYESQYVLNSTNSMKMWGEYAQYFKNMMQKQVAPSDKAFIFTAHTSDVETADSDGISMIRETKVKVKGSLMNQGIEAYFSTVVATKKMPLKKLEGYENDLLIITPEDEAVGYKHVFQTKLTKDTVHETIRSPMGMWSMKETYIDNNTQFLLNRLNEYYS